MDIFSCKGCGEILGKHDDKSYCLKCLSKRKTDERDDKRIKDAVVRKLTC